MPTAANLIGMLRASLRTHLRLVVENLALRHQIACDSCCGSARRLRES